MTPRTCRSCGWADGDGELWCYAPGDEQDLPSDRWMRWLRGGRRTLRQPIPLAPDGLPTEETLALRGPCPEWAEVEP